MPEECVDLNEVLERVQHDRELLLELFQIFLDDCPKKIEALKSAVKQADVQKIKDIAHSMKGASGNIAAKKINATFIIIEQMAKDNKIGEIRDKIGELDSQLAELRAYSKKLENDFKA